jgi:hypothetical protein
MHFCVCRLVYVLRVCEPFSGQLATWRLESMRGSSARTGRSIAGCILGAYSVLRIKCKPLSVSMIPLSSPTFKANAASSNGFCMAPRPKEPKSPPFLAELQSLSVLAKSGSVVLPDLMELRC